MEKWRLEHPHDTPPYRFTPSPTFGHSSPNDGLAIVVLDPNNYAVAVPDPQRQSFHLAPNGSIVRKDHYAGNGGPLALPNDFNRERRH